MFELAGRYAHILRVAPCGRRLDRACALLDRPSSIARFFRLTTPSDARATEDL